MLLGESTGVESCGLILLKEPTGLVCVCVNEGCFRQEIDDLSSQETICYSDILIDKIDRS